MIDTHNHILPGVDDGARSLEDSCAMAQALHAQGVTTVCATPHITEWSKAGNTADIERRLADLRQALAERGIDLELRPGGEVHMVPTVVRDVQERAAPTLNGSQYLLLEFPYDSLPPLFERIIHELQVHGLRVVLAHPERIGPLADDPSILFGLVQRGCLGQLTAMSLAGGFGPKLRDISELMLEHNLVHVVASDAHDAEPGGRLAAIGDARQAAERIVGPARAEAMFEELPRRMLAGEPVEVSEPIEYKKKHRSFLSAFR
jgi:protein-tyrosine phosphatase